MTRARMRLRVLAPIAVLALLLAGVPASARGATHQVEIADFAFSPAELTIAVGDTVTWTNRDDMVHTATSVSGAFDSGDLALDESYSLTFTASGTYDYLCTPHPSMTGRIIVVAAPAEGGATGGEIPNVALSVPSDEPPTLVALGVIAIIAAAGAAFALGARRARTRPR